MVISIDLKIFIYLFNIKLDRLKFKFFFYFCIKDGIIKMMHDRNFYKILFMRILHFSLKIKNLFIYFVNSIYQVS